MRIPCHTLDAWGACNHRDIVSGWMSLPMHTTRQTQAYP